MSVLFTPQAFLFFLILPASSFHFAVPDVCIQKDFPFLFLYIPINTHDCVYLCLSISRVQCWTIYVGLPKLKKQNKASLLHQSFLGGCVHIQVAALLFLTCRLFVYVTLFGLA